ncbi:gTPase, IMAP member 8 [Serendipita sp. 400]|nr:gTPase, IMAP member 8 [Serendipita sp. 400]
MRPCTKKITSFRLTPLGSNEPPIVLVDTPGFGGDDTDSVTFATIHAWLLAHTSVETVSIFWFCQIGSNRMTNSERQTWESFKSVCGEEAMRASVTVVSTGWESLGGTIHAEREQQLQTEFLTGCTFERLPIDTDPNFSVSACTIIDNAVPGSRLLLQREAIDEGKPLGQTTHGRHEERRKSPPTSKGIMSGIRKAFEFLGRKS